eukprot:s37_g14.t1
MAVPYYSMRSGVAHLRAASETVPYMLRLLCALADDGPHVRARLEASGGLQLVLHAMEVCVDFAEVQRLGCRLLGDWGHDDAGHLQGILDHHGLKPVVAGMQRHVSHVRVQEEASSLMLLIVRLSQEAREEVLAADAVEAMLDGMNANRKSDDLAFFGCSCMALLARGHGVAAERIAKHHGAKIIVRAMLVKRERRDLQAPVDHAGNICAICCLCIANVLMSMATDDDSSYDEAADDADDDVGDDDDDDDHDDDDTEENDDAGAGADDDC